MDLRRAHTRATLGGLIGVAALAATATAMAAPAAAAEFNCDASALRATIGRQTGDGVDSAAPVGQPPDTLPRAVSVR